MHDKTLELAHIEMLRLREAQSARIASVRARSSAVLAASGIATTLVTALGSNPFYAIAIIGFVLSSVYSVKSMWMTRVQVVSPRGVMHVVAGHKPFQARLELMKQLRDEYNKAEDGLQAVGNYTNVAMGWFIAGLAVAMFISIVAALMPVF